MAKYIEFSCTCGRKHRISRGADEKPHHEIIEPENPEPKPKEKRSLLDIIIGSDDE